MKKRSISQLLALGIFAVDALATGIVLKFCHLAILQDFTGSLPYLTTLIGALQGSTAVVLTAYYGKSRAENTKGGITYDAAFRSDEDC